jgi:hypothetical protein
MSGPGAGGASVGVEDTGLRTGALTARVKRSAVRRFYRPFAEKYPAIRNPLTPVRRAIALVGGTAGALGVLTMVFGISQEISEGAPDMVGQLWGMAAFVGLLLYAVILMLWLYLRTAARRGTPTRHYRLSRFATDNGMSYEPGPKPGSHLTPWAERGQLVLTRIMRPVSPRRIEFANYELRPGTTNNQTSQFGGLCAIRLSTRLPHIVLHARNGRTLTAAATPDRAQRLNLEGDFNEHFTLYCPAEYERDALYLFTPDVMARLIDRVHGFDVEIVDDWLFFVTARDVVTLDPAAWQGLLDATSALTDKISRWERWRDDRLPVQPRAATSASASAVARPATVARTTSGRVAKRGRRLRMNVGRGLFLWIFGATALIVAVIVSNLL